MPLIRVLKEIEECPSFFIRDRIVMINWFVVSAWVCFILLELLVTIGASVLVQICEMRAFVVQKKMGAFFYAGI